MCRGEYHTSQYTAACRMVAEGESLVVRARNTMCERREKAPLQVSSGQEREWVRLAGMGGVNLCGA